WADERGLHLHVGGAIGEEPSAESAYDLDDVAWDALRQAGCDLKVIGHAPDAVDAPGPLAVLASDYDPPHDEGVVRRWPPALGGRRRPADQTHLVAIHLTLQGPVPYGMEAHFLR